MLFLGPAGANVGAQLQDAEVYLYTDGISLRSTVTVVDYGKPAPEIQLKLNATYTRLIPVIRQKLKCNRHFVPQPLHIRKSTANKYL